MNLPRNIITLKHTPKKNKLHFYAIYVTNAVQAKIDQTTQILGLPETIVVCSPWTDSNYHIEQLHIETYQFEHLATTPRASTEFFKDTLPGLTKRHEYPIIATHTSLEQEVRSAFSRNYR